jgi:D-alanine transaminase
MIVHLNGELVDAGLASVSPFDRGYLFGDGVYEGLRSFGGRLVACDRHARRFATGLAEARIPWDASRLGGLSEQLLGANGLADAFVYWQVTRGVPGLGHPARARLPAGPMRPGVFGFCTPMPPLAACAEPRVTTVSVREDRRWERGHLKSIALMGNILGVFDAADSGADDVLFVRSGLLAEASASNVIIALPGRGGKTTLATPSLESVSILGGITRELILEAEPGIEVRPVRSSELSRASEVMLVGTSAMVTAVTAIDGRTLGDGVPGAQARRLHGLYLGVVRRELARHHLAA